MSMSESNVIAVTSRKLCSRPLEEQIERIAQMGVKKVILREKDLNESEYLLLAERVQEKCFGCNLELIIHSFPNVAHSLGINRLHMPLDKLTEDLSGEFAVLGTSIHSLEQLEKALSLGVSYVIAGHIFETDCKRGVPPRGLEFLKEICAASSAPVYAIGGINEENLNLVIEAGAVGGCMMSKMMKI